MGKIFNIQRFCTGDGPGIRTTVFFKGCPLRCIWCHNPESQSIKTEISYNSNRCLSCGKCVMRCPNGCHSIIDGYHIYHRSRCEACLKCVDFSCPAIDSYGYEISADEIMAEVMKDEAFYRNSKGGMTLSGGEPLSQPEFCFELLRKAKENGFHTCIETCGYASEEVLARSTELVDLYLFDYKETDPEKHKIYTGVDNLQILSNLQYLSSAGKKIVLRCPIIPSFNDTKAHLDGIASISNRLDGIEKIELEPYHDFGSRKYESLGKECGAGIKEIIVPKRETVDEILTYIQKQTDKQVALA